MLPPTVAAITSCGSKKMISEGFERFFNSPYTQLGAGLLSDPKANYSDVMSTVQRGLLAKRKAKLEEEMALQSAAKYRQEQADRARAEAARRQQAGLLAMPNGEGPPDPQRMQQMENIGLLQPGLMQEMLKQRFAPKPPELTTSQKDYLYGQQNPAFNEWKLNNNRSLAPQIKNAPVFSSGKGEEKLSEAIGKNIEARVGEYRDDAKAARQLKNGLIRFQSAMAGIGDTGPSAAQAKTIREFFGRFGYPIDDDALADAQKLDQSTKMMVAEQLRMNKGPQTDFDAKFTMEYMPGLATVTEANREAVRYLSSVTRLKQLFGSKANMTYDQADFRSMNSYLTDLDNKYYETPAVLQSSGGSWVTFEEFYKDAKKDRLSDDEILDEWISEAANARVN